MQDVQFVAIVSAASAIVGGLFGGMATVLSQWISRRQEAQRALMEFALKQAIENWRQVSERADALKMPRHEYGPSAMDGYLIRTLALIDLLQRRKFTAADVDARLLEMESIGQVLEKHLQKKRPQQPVQ